jgi:hypothetical protein
MPRTSALLCLLIAVPTVNAQAPSKIEDVIKKLEARFEPSDARPGQIVTLKIELKLAEGWQTYPTKQKDREARFNVTKITFPKDGAVQFSGKVTEPPDPTVREEPLLDIKEFHTYPGGGTWECEAIVSPSSEPGPTKVSVRFQVIVANPNGHFSPKPYNLDATINIAERLPKKKQ